MNTSPNLANVTDPVVTTDYLKALADSNRLAIALMVHEQQELCVCELMQALQQPQAKVSRHLAQLRGVGLLSDRRQGKWVFYRLSDVIPDWLFNMLKAMAEQERVLLSQMRQHLELMGQRPERIAKCCTTD
ncbi:metalloregulator ArsR/SmtB family transcription factor [Echinimonas agarilytica]|uniref:metalloregulator ArsR/SmtB family transcription factor n=1 Tax=Echinimonas agarilytica TaxID=1215918 RepID=UPI0032E4E3A6